MNIPKYWQRETKAQTPSGEVQIEDVISFRTEVLFLLRVPPSFGFPNKESLQCWFGSPRHQTKVLAVHLLQESLAAVVCGAPPKDLAWDTSSVLIKLDKDQGIRTGKGSPDYGTPLQWNSTKVVYEIFSTEKDVVVFAHGLNQTLFSERPEPSEEFKAQFKCVYANRFETAVTAQANEVFRCGHPPKSMIHAVIGKKVALKFERMILPSVAYYNPQTLKPVQIHTNSGKLQVSNSFLLSIFPRVVYSLFEH